MRKIRLSVLALMLLLVVSVGAVAAQDKTVIRAWTGSSSPVENEFKEAQIAAFEEANPDIDVELLIAPDYGTQLQTAFASGDYPEVFTVGQVRLPDAGRFGCDRQWQRSHRSPGRHLPWSGSRFQRGR